MSPVDIHHIMPYTISMDTYSKVVSLLSAGWAWQRVQAIVGEAVNVKSIFESMPDYMFRTDDGPVPDDYVDVLGEMATMLRLMRERIDACVITENIVGTPDKDFNLMMKFYFDMLDKYTSTIIKLKFMTPFAEGSDVTESITAPTLKELLDAKIGHSAGTQGAQTTLQ